MAGSEKRQRGKIHPVRCTVAEFNAIAAKANAAGLATGAFLRHAALGNPGPRAQKRLPIDHVALRKLLGELGRVGNNLNQIARALNADQQADLPELKAALRAYAETRKAIFEALHKSTEPEP